MNEPGLYSWKNPWLRNSVWSVIGVTVVSLLVGFVWLPAQQGDYTAEGLWTGICRAAGVPTRWSDQPKTTTTATRTTAVVLDRSMARAGSDEAVGLGATIALQCTICHGVRGTTASNAPNLAGQYPEVIIKQLDDYRSGDRINSVMQAYARALTPAQVRDVAAYYADLPRASNTTNTNVEPRLVRAGAPMRNIASCASCHGSGDHKLGAPWLQSMPKAYLVEQLTAFATGVRRNDGHGQMRNMARGLKPDEIDALATYYARPSID